MQTFKDRLTRGLVRDGRVMWIGIRPARRATPSPRETVTAVTGKGLVGDHYETRTNGARQVTLISIEDPRAIASFLGRPEIDPGLLRRNIVVEGMNLLALKDRRFRIGEAELEYSGTCDPCSRMEENLGPGGFNAMRGRGGVLARVITSGEIAVGDAVSVL